MLEHCCWDLLPFSHKSISDVGRLGLARSLRSNSSQRCSMVLRSGLCAGPSSSSTPTSTNHSCMDLALCTGALSCWNRKGPSPNCYHRVGNTESSRMSLCAVALRLPFTGTKGPTPWKNIPRPLFLHQTLQLTLCIVAGSVLQPSAKPRLVRHTARWWSAIHHSRELISTAPESNGGEIDSTPADAWHCSWWS